MAPKRAAASAPPHFSTPLYHTFPRLGTAPAPNLLSGNNSLPLGTFQHQPGHGPQAPRLRRGQRASPAGAVLPDGSACGPPSPPRPPLQATSPGPQGATLRAAAAACGRLRGAPPLGPAGPTPTIPIRSKVLSPRPTLRSCSPAAACGRPRSLIPLPPSPAPNGRSAAGTAAPSPRCPTASAPRKKPAQLPRSWPGAPPFSAKVPPKAP